jgi:hypothetical protein
MADVGRVLAHEGQDDDVARSSHFVCLTIPACF